MKIPAIRALLHGEAAAGLILVIAAAIAMVWANSSAAPLYDALLALPVGIRVGDGGLVKPLVLWINDGLMAVFFLYVGLEIKREVREGQLSSRARATLPGIAAVGGMVAPALVYALFNHDDPQRLNGWAIPAATDIAFAIGVLALAGSKVPASLRVFLLALAIMDDLGAIIIIAAFYTSQISSGALGLAAVALLALAWMNIIGVRRLAPYLLVGAFLWVCVLKSGVHATLAGVALAFAIPMTPGGADPKASAKATPLAVLEHALHPWVTFVIMPVFALANAGVPLAGVSLGVLAEPLPLGIMLGLFLGKQAGVMLTAWLAVRAGVCAMPAGATWRQFYGVALLTGIGFTMSLFIGNLAFSSPEYAVEVRLGVLAGSIASALAGYLVLATAPRRGTARVSREAAA
ncbi:NhaA family Na+:H+ antiporter [Azospirillum fermentarium]|uniref:Na+/H+ antiporter NhaA n=1 Tax=Azospirillum fermentarium TaxID=1233114 RepID=UPI002225CF4D|nr:Na+/H+ antiporter NhaA [Azospirillum fermentarium]MCW2245530.1 NhaA family Na+:H+ antiporter [Azospirillum fermentarium]